MNITELREKSLRLAHEGRSKLDTIKEDGSNAAEVEAEFGRIMAESDTLAARATSLEKIEARERDFAQITTKLPNSTVTVEGRGADQSDEEKRSANFESYLRGSMSLGELRANGVATDPKGGALVPQVFVAQLISKLQSEGPMLDPTFVNMLVTATGAPIEMPTFDDTARAVIIGENTQIPEDDLAFGSKTLTAYKYTSKLVRISNELLQDAAVNVADITSTALSKRIGRGLNEDLTVGTGSGMPMGVATAASVGVTAASATGVAADELFALQHSIDPAYRPNSTWMLSDAAVLKFRTMKATDGTFIWAPGLSVDAPASILGRPYRVNPFFNSAFTTGKVVALFGDFKQYYVRRVMDVYVRRLDERYADFDQAGLVALARYDGNLMDNSAIKSLKLA